MNENEKKTVLFVDDEERILKTIKRIVFKKPFNAFFANSGPRALEIMAQEEVHVIVTDMRMPEMTGLDLLRIVKEKYPKCVRIVLSGYTQITTLLTAINQGEIFRYIMKPWEKEEELLSVIMEGLDHVNTGEPAPVMSSDNLSL